QGVASTTAIANAIAGDYQVRADIGVSEVNFDLTNIAAPVVVVPDNSTVVVAPGDPTVVVDNGDSTPVVVPGNSNPVVIPNNSNPIADPGNSTLVIVNRDSTTNTVPDFTPIWQSVLEYLPEYGLEESACQTTPAVVINSKVEEITLDEAIETEIQRNQDCQPAGRSN
ncbi:MAG: hypothetical protein F6K47_27880, partial [Symploca sp. SIO2E6]|nr:hypothetical protein [Symploca sp. SIO2E6]